MARFNRFPAANFMRAPFHGVSDAVASSVVMPGDSRFGMPSAGPFTNVWFNSFKRRPTLEDITLTSLRPPGEAQVSPRFAGNGARPTTAGAVVPRLGGGGVVVGG